MILMLNADFFLSYHQLLIPTIPKICLNMDVQSQVAPNTNLNYFQKNISVPEDEWYEEWTSDDFMALPELVTVAYENQHHNPKLQYLTGVARDDAAYMICKFLAAI